jgi:hypothetical protein
MGRITGAGRSFKLDTCPDVKFSIKEFSEKYYSNSELQEAFDEAVKEEYLKFIPDESTYNTKKETKIEKDNEEETVSKVKKTSNKKKSKYTLYEEGDGTEDNPDIYRDNNGHFFIIEDGEYVEIELEDEE